MKKKLMLFIVLVLVLVLVLLLLIFMTTGCSKESGKSSGTPEKVVDIKKHYKFGAIYMTLNNPYFVALNNGIKDVVEANGDILIALDPALDPNNLVAAAKAGIPIINVDSPVYDTELVLSIIASDNYNAGVTCAKDMMGKLGSAKIVILEHPTAKSSIDRTQGFIDTIAGMDQYEIVAQQSSEGQLEQAMPVMKNIIRDNSEINVVMALNDPTAMGAIAALQEANRENEVLIYGVDGAPEAKQMIKDGKMTASAAQSPITIGITAATVAYDILAGKEVEKEIFIDIIFIDVTNVDEYGTIDWQ